MTKDELATEMASVLRHLSHKPGHALDSDDCMQLDKLSKQWYALANNAAQHVSVTNYGNIAAASAGDQHPDDVAVDNFAAAMKAKMAASRAKGRGGWDDPAQCTANYLQSMLIDHLAKGDPTDIGNFAMMLWNRGERVAAASAPLGARIIVEGNTWRMDYLSLPEGVHNLYLRGIYLPAEGHRAPAASDSEQDAKDAARYRWVRDAGCNFVWAEIGAGACLQSLDRAIDAAMAAGGQK